MLIKAGRNRSTPAQVDQLSIAGGTCGSRFSASSGTSRTRVISIPTGGSGRLDLSDNDLIVAAGGTDGGTLSGSSYTGVTGLIARGRNGGSWSGSGIVTSQPDAIGVSHRTSLGVATAAQVSHIGTFQTALWNGQTVSGGDTLVMYTTPATPRSTEKSTSTTTCRSTRAHRPAERMVQRRFQLRRQGEHR